MLKKNPIAKYLALENSKNRSSFFQYFTISFQYSCIFCLIAAESSLVKFNQVSLSIICSIGVTIVASS